MKIEQRRFREMEVRAFCECGGELRYWDERDGVRGLVCDSCDAFHAWQGDAYHDASDETPSMPYTVRVYANDAEDASREAFSPLHCETGKVPYVFSRVVRIYEPELA